MSSRERVRKHRANVPQSAPLVPETERLLPPATSVPVPLPQFVLDEEQYVQRELSITRSLIKSGRLRDVDADGKPLHTLERNEAYLRWRYRGFMLGEVTSL